MKKITFCFLLCLVSICTSAQLMRTEELEKYAVSKYGDKWTDAAQKLKGELVLDKNNSLTYTQIIDCGTQTKGQLYVKLNYWFTATFNDANSVIKLNDKEVGVIIAQGLLTNIATHFGGANSYDVSIRPIIKVDIKDGKVRVTYTVQDFDVVKLVGGGVLGAFSSTHPSRFNEKWTLDGCFPFVEKDTHGAKRTSSKALVMTHAYSNVLMDKIEEALKNGIVGNENDNW